MDKDTVLKILSSFRSALQNKGIKVAKLILFGSYATDKYREGSDIDVIVISEGFKGKDYWERTEILSDAIYAVFQPIEAIALTPEEWEGGESVVADYAKNGEVVCD